MPRLASSEERLSECEAWGVVLICPKIYATCLGHLENKISARYAHGSCWVRAPFQSNKSLSPRTNDGLAPTFIKGDYPETVLQELTCRHGREERRYARRGPRCEKSLVDGMPDKTPTCKFVKHLACLAKLEWSEFYENLVH